MKIVIENVSSKVLVGGKDNLLGIDIIGELREYFKERPQNYSQTSAYKKRQWDGYKRFITPSGQIATGFLPVLLKKLDSMHPDLEVLLEDKRKNVPTFKDEIVMDIGNAENWQLRERELRLLQGVRNNVINFRGQTLPFHRGVMDAATNTGKTSFAVGLCHNLVDCRFLYIVESVLIYRQAVKFFREVFGEVGEVSNKKEIYLPVTIAMAKTLHNRLKSKLATKVEVSKFNTVVIDECDTAHSPTYQVVYKALDAGCLVLMSGTPFDMADKCKKLIIVGMGGKTLAKVTNQELIDAGVSQRPIVNIHYVPLENLGSYSRNREQSQTSEKKLSIIAKLMNEGQMCLASCSFEVDGRTIADYLTELGVQVEFTHGKDPLKDEKLDAFKARQFSNLIATMIIKKGVNYPAIRRLVRTEGGKSKITTKQLVGRAVRHDGVNETVEVHDFYEDDNKWLAKHSRIRIKQYREEGFEVVLHYPAKKNGAPK